MASRSLAALLFAGAMHLAYTQAPDAAAAAMPTLLSVHANCRVTGMTITALFDRPYDGIIYSKGSYYKDSCVYVEPQSGESEYVFTIPMNACGTQVDFDTSGDIPRKYFENTIVFQSDPTFQEMWDKAKKIRCEWQTRFEETVVFQPIRSGMLEVQTLRFGGDSATTTMAVQVGEGPYAPVLDDELVQLGDELTLVIYVSTVPSFDVRVRDCYATDSRLRTELALSDPEGCSLNDKLLGEWQTTRDIRDTGASVIAYARFSAFKFPDDMEVNVRCNVAVCKNGCPAPQCVDIKETQVEEQVLFIDTTTTSTTTTTTTTTSAPTTRTRARTTTTPAPRTFAPYVPQTKKPHQPYRRPSMPYQPPPNPYAQHKPFQRQQHNYRRPHQQQVWGHRGQRYPPQVPFNGFSLGGHNFPTYQRGSNRWKRSADNDTTIVKSQLESVQLEKVQVDVEEGYVNIRGRMIVATPGQIARAAVGHRNRSQLVCLNSVVMMAAVALSVLLSSALTAVLLVWSRRALYSSSKVPFEN